jgi:WD40 repeat protein
MTTAEHETAHGRRFCVTVAVDRYHHLPEEAQLSRPSADAELITQMLQTFGYEQPISGMGNYWPADQIRSAIGLWARDARFQANDAVVVYFAGHGIVEDRDRHYLLCSNSDPADLDTALPTEDLVRTFVRNGLRNLLVVLDVCYAGAGAADGAQYVLRTVARQVDAREGGGVWFLSAARAKEEAVDGGFVTAFLAGLTDAQERTGQRQQYLDLVDVVAAVNRQFKNQGAPQRAELAAGMVTGLPPFLDNTGYRPNLPHGDTDLELQRILADRELLDHFGPRSRGVEFDSEPGLYFNGRARVLDELVSWLTSEQGDGMGRVVTGSPGCGKSAVLGRIVALSDPGYRNKLITDDDSSALTVPERLVDVAVHARHKGLPEIVQHIATTLKVAVEGTGHLLRELSLRARKGPPIVIVVDALDEAGSGTASDTEGRGEPRRIARELLRPLSEIPGVRLLIGARRELISSLGTAVRVLDLDHGYLGTSDIAGYVTKVLLARNEPEVRTPYRDNPELADVVGKAVANRAAGVFLVARMTARGLRSMSDTIDITRSGWQDELPAEIGEAFEDYLKRFGADEQRVRTLMTPLAFAEGQGLPRGTLWTEIAAELSGREFGEHDIDWLLDQAAAYIAEVPDRGRSVYRLYHQALAEHLRATWRTGQPAAQERIVRALLSSVPRTEAGDPDWLASQPYVRTHLATHAGAAGGLDELLADPGFLLAADQLILLRALPKATSESARQVRAAYEQAAHQLVESTPLGERASYLQLSASRCEAGDFARHIDALGVPMPWRTRWSWWSPTGVHRQLIGHEKAVNAVASGELDGRPIALTGSADETARIWDLMTQRQLGEPLRNGSPVTAVAIGELGEFSIGITGGSDGRLLMWDLSSGQLLGRPMTGHMNAVTSVAIGSIDGDAIAVSASRDGTARVWRLEDQTAVGEAITGHRGSINSVALGTLGKQPVILTGGQDNRARVWDLRTHAVLGEPLTGHTQPVTSAVFGQLDERQVVVTGSQDGTIAFWDLATRQQIGEPLWVSRYGIDAVSIGQVGDQQVVLACTQTRAAAWSLRTRQPVGQPLVGHHGPVWDVTFGIVERNPVALTAGNDGTARIWDLRAERPPGGHTGKVRCAAIDNVDGRVLGLTGSADTTVVVWDLDAEGRQDGLPLLGHRATVSAVALGQVHGRTVAVTGDEDAVIKLWDLDRRQCTSTFPTKHNGKITDLALTEIDNVPILASGSVDGSIRLWNLETYEEMGAPLTGHNADVDMLMFCEVNDRAVVVGATRKAEATRWDLRSRQRSVVGDSALWENWSVLALGSVDGRRVALLGASNNSLLLWDVVTNTAIGDVMTGHTAIVTLAAIGIRDGRPVAITGSNDGTARLWDLRTCQPIGEPLPGHQPRLEVLAIGSTAAGAVAITSTLDDDVRLWSLTSYRQIGDMLTGDAKQVRDLAILHDSGRRRVVTVGSDAVVRILDMSDGRLCAPLLNGHRLAAFAVAATQLEGKVAISSGWDSSLRIWDLDTYQERFRLGHSGYAYTVAVAVREGKPFLVAGVDSTVVVWDLVTKSIVAEMTGHTGVINDMRTGVMDGTNILVTGSRDSTARLWDLDNLQPVGEPLRGHSGDVNTVELTIGTDTSFVYTGDDDGVVRGWRLTDGAEVPLGIPKADRWVSALAAARVHDRDILAVASFDGAVRLVCLETQSTLTHVQLATPASTLAFAEDSALCLGTEMGMVVLEVKDWASQ